MGYDINRVTIIGRLTRDPESRTVGNDNTTITSFGIAVGYGQDKANFFDCEAWGRCGELVAQHLTKGSQCAIDGCLKTAEWTDKATGARRTKVLIRADQVQFLTKSQRGNDGNINQNEETPF